MLVKHLASVMLLVVMASLCWAQPGGPDTPPTPTVDFEETQVGDGEPVESEGAFETSVKVWEDKYEGTPFGRGELKLTVAVGYTQLPGLANLAQGMRSGGKRRATLTAQQLFGEVPDNAPFEADKPFFLEMTVLRVFPAEPLEQSIVKAGEGKEAAAGDAIRVNYRGWLEDFESDKLFDQSEHPFTFELGASQVIPGWEKGLLGMKAGETRRLKIPHYLAYGADGKDDIPPLATLYFEVELVEFVSDGELQTSTVKEGQGEGAAAGDEVEVHYVGWLHGFETGEPFDSSRARNKPFTLTLGQGRVIKGWEQGLLGMKVGELRRLTIPHNFGYGAQGHPPVIPPFSTLYFEVERLR